MDRDHELEHLHAHAFTRQRFEALARCDAGSKSPGVGRPGMAIGGVEAKEAQDAQIVLGDAPVRIADEAHAPRGEIIESADMIEDHAVAGGIKRVDCEVTPLGVTSPVAPEHDLGMAPESFDVPAQCRHLERPAVDHDGNGAVLHAGRHRPETGGGGAAHHLLRDRRGREVDVAHRFAQERIAHRAADNLRLFSVAVEHVDEARQRALAQPGRVKPAGQGHLLPPGTSLPSSMCAGM